MTFKKGDTVFYKRYYPDPWPPGGLLVTKTTRSMFYCTQDGSRRQQADYLKLKDLANFMIAMSEAEIDAASQVVVNAQINIDTYRIILNDLNKGKEQA